MNRKKAENFNTWVRQQSNHIQEMMGYPTDGVRNTVTAPDTRNSKLNESRRGEFNFRRSRMAAEDHRRNLAKPKKKKIEWGEVGGILFFFMHVWVWPAIYGIYYAVCWINEFFKGY
jgi:hypothetical protein